MDAGWTQRTLPSNWMPMTHGCSMKSSKSRISDTLSTSPPIHDGSASSGTWNGWTPNRISTRLLMCRHSHLVTEGDAHSHTTWLRGIDAAVQSANVGIHSARRKANDRVCGKHIINTGHGNTPLWGMLPKKETKDCRNQKQTQVYKTTY